MQLENCSRSRSRAQDASIAEAQAELLAISRKGVVTLPYDRSAWRGITGTACSGRSAGRRKKATRRQPFDFYPLEFERSEGERRPILRAPAGDEAEPRETEQHHYPGRGFGDPRRRRRVGERHANGMPLAWASRLVGVQDECSRRIGERAAGDLSCKAKSDRIYRGTSDRHLAERFGIGGPTNCPRLGKVNGLRSISRPIHDFQREKGDKSAGRNTSSIVAANSRNCVRCPTKV
jgi:hypothetical protein